MKSKNIAFIILLIFSFSFSSAQQIILTDSVTADSVIVDTINIVEKDFQFSVFHPLGTNGAKLYYANKLSINLLFGYEGALRGTEIGLIGNFNEFFTTGLQISGFVNNCGGELEGTQISFLYNNAKTVKGKQIGLINICDTLNGTQCGFFNVNQSSEQIIEVWANESFYLNMGYKIRSDNHYRIIAVGVQPFGAKFKTTFGVGLGKEKILNENKFRNNELLLLQVNENEFFTSKLNTIVHLRHNYGKQLQNGNKVFAGINLNFMFSMFKNTIDNKYGSDISPWPIVDTDIIKNKLNFQFWPGITMGLRF